MISTATRTGWSNIRLVPQDMVLFRQLQSEGVLLDMRGEEYYGLNEVATRLWIAVMSSPNLAEAVQTLLSEYDVEPQELERDLAELLNDLENRGLISSTPIDDSVG